MRGVLPIALEARFSRSSKAPRGSHRASPAPTTSAHLRDPQPHLANRAPQSTATRLPSKNVSCPPSCLIDTSYLPSTTDFQPIFARYLVTGVHPHLEHLVVRLENTLSGQSLLHLGFDSTWGHVASTQLWVQPSNKPFGRTLGIKKVSRDGSSIRINHPLVHDFLFSLCLERGVHPSSFTSRVQNFLHPWHLWKIAATSFEAYVAFLRLPFLACLRPLHMYLSILPEVGLQAPN